MTYMSDTHVTVTFSQAQAERLLALVDAENSATKNRLVSAVLATGDYRNQAEHLAQESESLTALRATIARAQRS
jgi:hypothetical protein